MEPPSGSISMMQIDCEVMATKLVTVDKATVPEMHKDTNSSAPADPPRREANNWQRRKHPLRT